MSREPFDEMKQKNPVAPDRLPGAPMSVAERIVARRVRHTLPGWAMAAVAAVSVAVVGFGLLWFLDGGNGADVAGGDTTITTAVTTTEFSTTSAPNPPQYSGQAPYFFLDTTGPGWEGGPFLVPVARIAEGNDFYGAMAALLEGPTADEAAAIPAMSTAIPEGTVLLDVDYGADGVVTVDFSSEFVSGGGTLSMMGRLAQVVFTLDVFDGVEGVRFEVEGVPTTVFGGEGIIVNDPATSADFESLLPAVMIDSPVYGGLYGANPMVAYGTANVFEATVSLALTDADGLIIWEGFTTATCGTGCRGEWEISIPYEVDAPQMGSLIAWESSAMDGSQTNVREHPVWLVPFQGGSTTTTPATGCSGALAADLVEQTGVPEAVAEKRAAIHAAAQACDWVALESLMADSFSYTFGVDEDPIAYWQEREAAGDRVMFYLAELLNRPVGIQAAGDITYYAWPSAFVTEWSAVPEADREALHPLYGDEEFAFWAEAGGYIGYRVGILEDGTWVYFIAGD
jgi:hypothetical protein